MSNKRSAGRNTHPNGKIPDVRNLPCSHAHAPGATHRIVTGNDLASACLWCGISWAALDAQVRKGLA